MIVNETADCVIYTILRVKFILARYTLVREGHTEPFYFLNIYLTGFNLSCISFYNFFFFF